MRFKHRCFFNKLAARSRDSCLRTYDIHVPVRTCRSILVAAPTFFVSRYLYCTNYRSLLLDIKLILLSMEKGHHSGAHWRKDEILSLIAIWREDKIFEETKSTVDKKGGVHHHIRKIKRSWFSAKCETDSKQDPFPSPRI